jgi:hypothetical protein
MNERPSPEEITQGLRTGYSFDPRTPGLQAAARDLLRPIIESLDGQEIVYVCRFPRLMRVAYLEVDDEGFRAVGTHVHDIDNPIMLAMAERRRRLEAAKGGIRVPPQDKAEHPKPFNFGARWAGLRLSGSAVCMAMITDHFYPDPAVVAEVKAAVVRNASPSEIAAILERASSK